jgi:hypothetical protein
MLGHIDISQLTLEAPLWALVMGAAVGFAHVFVGADHLAAVMPMSVNRKLKAAWVGVRWGVGHSMGMLLVAILLLAGRSMFNLEPDPDWVDRWGHVLIGLLLVGLGAWGVYQARTNKLHVHEHSHDDEDGPVAHSHMHVHKGGGGKHMHVHSHAAYAVGTLHGVAGVAHFAAVLPALAAPSVQASFAYLGGFMVGTVLALALFTAVFGVVTARLGQRSPKFIKGSMYFAAAACLVIGAGFVVVPLLGIEHWFHHHH